MSDETPKFKPPYTSAEVKSINGFQESRVFHPFTCPNDAHDPDEVILEATKAGMRCPKCEYTQDWVWHWMADGGWETIWGPDLKNPMTRSVQE